MKLVIATKNYSSWSLRPWVLMKEKNINFSEILIPFEPEDKFNNEVDKISASGKVPVLIDADLKIWDSLAIIEYLHEKFPQKFIYPQNPKQRAYARCVCAQMHSGFPNMRKNLPMNVNAKFKNTFFDNDTNTEIAEILAIWDNCLTKHKKEFLLGEFSAVDAYYAPVVFRFITYDIKLSTKIKKYCQKILSLSSIKQWIADSKKSEWVSDDEPYRLKK